MKKMIPVYFLQLTMLVAILIFGTKMLQEVRTLRTELSSMTDTGTRKPRSAPALRISLVNEPMDVHVENLFPIPVETQR